MPGYPVVFNLQDKRVTVVGAGLVGRRKVEGLLKAGAKVRLVSLETPEATWLEQVEHCCRPFREGDLDGAVLAFAATGNLQVDQAVQEAAHHRGIPVNHATTPARGDFHLPAVLQQGDLQIGVATNGQAPALAKLVRDRLRREFGPEWHLVLEIAAVLRERKLTGFDRSTYSYKVLENLLALDLPELIARRDGAAIDHALTRATGAPLSLAALGLQLPSDETS